MRLIVRDDVEMSSKFSIHNNQVIPQLYHYRQTGGDAEKNIVIKFKNNRACNLKSKQCWQQKANREPLFDPLSLDIAFPLSLQKSLSNHRYNVVSGDKQEIQQTQFIIEGHETIDVPAGHFDTIRILMKETGKKRPTRLWLAKEIQYLPIKIIFCGSFLSSIRRG